MIVLAFLLVIGLFACGGSSEDSSSGGSSGDAGSTATEAESQFPITVADGEKFKFEILECDDFWGDYTVKITNKTDQDFTFSCDNAVVNDEATIDMFIYSDIAAGTSAKDSFMLSETDIGDYEEGTKLNFKVKYRLVNETLDEVGSGTLKFSLTNQ